jgi:hypothetical protein
MAEPDNVAAKSSRWAVAALLVVVLTTSSLTWLVLSRQGNLGWDDADYLRRGYHIVGLATEHGGFDFGRIVTTSLKEKPKPPWLVGWIELGALLFGKRHLDAVIVFASVIPYLLLMIATSQIAGRRFGASARLFALLVLIASPMGLSFGGKVMVETFMALWILLIYDLAATLLERPTPRTAALLGLALGAAMLTKLTVALLLPVPALIFTALFIKRFGIGRETRRVFLSILAPVLILAGPWYVTNGPAAIDFARFSARYNIEAQGLTESTPRLRRIGESIEQLPGWPLTGLLCVATTGLFLAKKAPTATAQPRGNEQDFALISVAGALSGILILLLPSYFDPRFLLPVWPALAVVSGGVLASLDSRLRLSKWLICPLLVGCVYFSWQGNVSEPRLTTYWSTQRLLDDLVHQRHANMIGNVGNTPAWNVCKTGLMNELRDSPSDCYVLHDLSQATPEIMKRRLSRFDAVLILDPQALPKHILEQSPGLNRAYAAAATLVTNDARFERLPLQVAGNMPPVQVFVKRK